LFSYYPKDPSIEQDLVPIKSCKTCTYQYGFNDLICLECCQLSNWKEGTVVEPKKEVEETVIEKDLILMRLCADCIHMKEPTGEVTCLYCVYTNSKPNFQRKKAKEADISTPLNEKEIEVSTINSQGAGLRDGLTAPIYPSLL
jgi:hypothetical protein